MKKHAGIIFLFILIISGCRSHKTVTRAGESTHTEQITEKAVEQSYNEEQKGSQIHTSEKEEVVEYTKVSVIDSTGNVRTIQETWRQSGRTQLAVRSDSSRNISLSDVVLDKVITNQHDSIYNENVVTKNDSRPIQGSDWVWLVLSLILVVIIFIYIKRKI